MRVLFDANVYLSYLVKPLSQSAVSIVVGKALAGEFTVVLADEIAEEMLDVIERKPYFLNKVTPFEVRNLIARIAAIATTVMIAQLDLREVAVDPDDDYLFAAAVRGRADYIVSGDRHVLLVGEYQGIPILNARQFLLLLLANEP
jgi:putative PIN family toxin of toxin-antitoxin system